MKPRRIFIAVDISDAARAECARHIDELRRRFPTTNLRWERSEKLHLTLKFLGDTEASTLAKLEEPLERVASDISPFTLALSGVGVFPSRQKPRVPWIGIKGEDDALSTLAGQVDAECEQLGYEREGRRFSPHLTIGRVRPPFKSLSVIDEHLAARIEPVTFDVTSLVIYESQLSPTGSVYSVVSRLQLK
jgi:2'-5' RNA ligase